MFMLSAVLASTGIGALSAREAEGRANISSADKVRIPSRFVIVHHLGGLDQWSCDPVTIKKKAHYILEVTK